MKTVACRLGQEDQRNRGTEEQRTRGPEEQRNIDDRDLKVPGSYVFRPSEQIPNHPAPLGYSPEDEVNLPRIAWSTNLYLYLYHYLFRFLSKPLPVLVRLPLLLPLPYP